MHKDVNMTAKVMKQASAEMSVGSVKTECLRIGNACPTPARDLRGKLFVSEDRGMDRMTTERAWRQGELAEADMEEEGRLS